MSGGMKPKRILIVDDQPSNSLLLKVMLEQGQRYLARTESDPRNTLEAAREFLPDLILLDVMMPGLDGGGVATLLQSDLALSQVPIIFLTGLVGKGEHQRGGGVNGGYTFVGKPVSKEDLLACVAGALGEDEVTGAGTELTVSAN